MSFFPKIGNRGIALIVTLTIITVLVTVSLELNRQVRSSVSDSAAYRDRLNLRHMVRSGVNLAEAVLVRDKKDTEFDSVQEDWANQERMREYIAELPFAEGDLTVRITDELSKIQVNALVDFPDGRQFNQEQQKMWHRFIDLMLDRMEEAEDFSFKGPVEASGIINPVKDWLDSGDDNAITGLSGAENPYYDGLAEPYSCRNGPVRHLRELLRIKGITDELFYSTATESGGLSRYITVHGMEKAEGGFSYPGKININTAEVPVLAGLLPEGREFLAPEIAAYRGEKEGGEYIHDLTGSTWYQEVPGCSDLEIAPELITTRSDIFRIHCRAERNGRQMAAEVVVERRREEEGGKRNCRVLRWQYQ
ncbi:MAG: type II secretion system protein GspK [Desulfosalsimonadaceae bacterium]